MANRATLIKRAIIVLGSPIALGYILMKATSRDPQKDLAALTPEQRQQIEVNRRQNKELFEAMLSEDAKKKLREKQQKAQEKQEARRY